MSRGQWSLDIWGPVDLRDVEASGSRGVGMSAV